MIVGNHKRSCSSIDGEDGSNFERLIDVINQPISIPPFVPLTPPLPDKQLCMVTSLLLNYKKSILRLWMT